MRTTMTGETAAQPMERKELAKAKRIVIKVGTSSLTTNYRLDPAKVEKLTTEIVALKQQGKEVILVTSGAIGAGIGKLDLKQRPRDMKVLQATAAVGQNILMSTYDHYFAEHGQTIAQILLTHGAFFNRQRYLNLRNTLSTLLKFGVIPIINENDTVAVDEIKLGDNDNLSALVASNLGADLLIILTDTEGLYTHNPQRDKNAQLIPVVTEITPEIEQTAGKGRKAGVGGMTTKLQAAKIVMQAGIPLVMASSREERILRRILEGERIGTLFLPEKKAMNGRRHWIGFAATPKGKIMVDDGAKRALIENGVSLLASGITGVEKTFKSGETVSIVDAEGVEFARGISNYASSEIELIKGAQSREIKQILGRKGYTEVVYRGNMVLL
jgi:glutamate 5-kinase